MSDTMIEKILKRAFNKNTTLLISAITYHSIISLIPTLLLTLLILDYLSIDIGINLDNIFIYIGGNLWTNLLIASFTIYLISRMFLILFKDKFSLIKSLFFSILGSIFTILFCTSFLLTYLIENNYLEPIFKLLVLLAFFLIVNLTLTPQNLKHSLLFSLPFSTISFLLFYFFFTLGKSLTNYENYYGILSPIFLIILAINSFIYIVYISYIITDEFTKNSIIKSPKESKIIKARLQKRQ